MAEGFGVEGRVGKKAGCGRGGVAGVGGCEQGDAELVEFLEGESMGRRAS